MKRFRAVLMGLGLGLGLALAAGGAARAESDTLERNAQGGIVGRGGAGSVIPGYFGPSSRLDGDPRYYNDRRYYRRDRYYGRAPGVFYDPYYEPYAPRYVRPRGHYYEQPYYPQRRQGRYMRDPAGGGVIRVR